VEVSGEAYMNVLGTAGNMQFISSGHTSKNFQDRGQDTSNKEILKGQNITLNLTTLYSIILPIKDWIFQNISLSQEVKTLNFG
jgi:hypothetical protein